LLYKLNNQLNKIFEIKFLDIVDESDEILKAGVELIYSLGHKVPLKGH